MPPAVRVYFYPGSTFSGALVRWWTRSRWGHCSVCVGGTVYESVGGGVSKRLTNHYEATATELGVPGADPSAVAAWCEAQLGKKYDWPALWLTGLAKWYRGGYKLQDNRRGAYDCSRLVVAALGLDTGRLSGPPSPEDVYELMQA